MTNRTIAIIGGGSIGVAFSVVFARAGATVRVHEPDPQRRLEIPDDATQRLSSMDRHGLLSEPVETIATRIQVETELASAVAGVDLVQECIPERLEFK